MNSNPWLVENISAFNFLCCPECVYRSKEEISFQTHALQNHSQSRALFLGDKSYEKHQIEIDPTEIKEEFDSESNFDYSNEKYSTEDNKNILIKYGKQNDAEEESDTGSS